MLLEPNHGRNVRQLNQLVAGNDFVFLVIRSAQPETGVCVCTGGVVTQLGLISCSVFLYAFGVSSWQECTPVEPVFSGNDFVFLVIRSAQPETGVCVCTGGVVTQLGLITRSVFLYAIGVSSWQECTPVKPVFSGNDFVFLVIWSC